MASLPETYYYYAGMADKITGDTIPINKADTFNYTLREPIGVIGIIVPWNSPLYLLSNALAPSLAIGNTVVVKPAENTTASALEFAALVAEAGFPPGVFNVVTGLGESTGDALTRHPGINKIAFTGGTETGRKVASNAAGNLVPCTMELGGKSPHVVFEDADPERAANGIVAGVFSAGGQTCIAGSRCFLQETIYDQVLEKLTQKSGQVIIGDPLAEDTQLGPLALRSQLDKVLDYIEIGLADGGHVVSGGKQPGNIGSGRGYYVEPTVFTDISNDMQLAREEIFGPVVAVMPFTNEQDLIEKANDTVYGLAAGIWTRDIDRAMRFARDIDAGTVWINTYRSASFMSPFGGFKQSGYGKHNGMEGIREFSRLKNVVVDYSGNTQDPFVLKLK
jgi:aldehyde dehydrogenase (NAD+)